MKFVVQAKIKNGLLWQAVEKCGSQANLAEYLGVSSNEISRWLLFKDSPNFRNPDRKPKSRARDEVLDMKLVALTGYGLEEIFPPEVQEHQETLGKLSRVQRLFESPVEELAALGAMTPYQLPPSPFELMVKDDLHSQIAAALDRLKPKEAKVLEMRFGLNGKREHPLEEVGQYFGVTRERIRQIEAKALRKLRNPKLNRNLKEFHCISGKAVA